VLDPYILRPARFTLLQAAPFDRLVCQCSRHPALARLPGNSISSPHLDHPSDGGPHGYRC